ncbi:hypothetical protein Arno18_35 [Pectobacterium phage Arno18]|uniref:Uncharacterized protein n=1 Tax=Pectobacterium phage Arno18 TaxID=2500578 RepID=A0A678ZJX5_9CAUD|nr:hypothetical protein Arno18_35 [Pectobacterium phage Arno18]
MLHFYYDTKKGNIFLVVDNDSMCAEFDVDVILSLYGSLEKFKECTQLSHQTLDGLICQPFGNPAGLQEF